jgi:D-sedoheptulose 7-phosphate isomerase
MPFREYLKDSTRVLEATGASLSESLAHEIVETIAACILAGKPLLVCGNGGSASDAMHITGELVGRFLLNRRALKVICLADNAAVLTALGNDYGFEAVFARQVEAYGEPGAVLLGISTSGNSRNVVAAFEKARELGMPTIALTGEGGGSLTALADYVVAVPSRCVPLIQQAHLCIYHYLCDRIEQRLASA